MNSLALSGVNLASNENLNSFHGSLPIKTLPEFQDFDEKVKEGSEQHKALATWMTKCINCTDCFKTAISRVLKSIIAKPVQIEYSGCGRAMKGVQKLNFSATSTYKIMKTLIGVKFAVPDEVILSKTSRWLSGVNDREGGRNARKSNSI